MRALVCNAYGPPESLVIEERDDPLPAADQVVVDIAAAGINFPDVLIIAGKYQVKTKPPFIPGNEASGVVSALGENASRFAIGDKVIVTPQGGAFAGKCAVEESRVTALPAGLDFAQGAGYTVTYGTSYHALKQCAKLAAGETVLVLGAAGGVGIAAVEIAKTMGARVIAAASDDLKLAFASEAGADAGINYGKTPLRNEVKELTAGSGADVVYDPVGGELAQDAFRSLAWHGRHLVVGFASGDIPSFPANIALLKEASVVGVWWGTWAAKNPQAQLQNMQELSALIAAGRIRPRVTEAYALDDYRAAFASITGRRARGKVILTII
ncbi:MAG TPA: NADPH:quinone oxidoreductase family protein [Woeseiaceae bacterium]|jgi:NADPH2:quinone reductase